MYAIFVLAVK